MVSVKGIYDGKNVKPIEKLPKGKFKVIITLMESFEDEEIRGFSDNEAFDFWNSSEEDLYQDYLNKN